MRYVEKSKSGRLLRSKLLRLRFRADYSFRTHNFFMTPVAFNTVRGSRPSFPVARCSTRVIAFRDGHRAVPEEILAVEKGAIFVAGGTPG